MLSQRHTTTKRKSIGILCRTHKRQRSMHSTIGGSQRTVLISTMDVNSASTTETEDRQSERSNSGNSILDHTILVSDGPATSQRRAYAPPIVIPAHLERLEIIRTKYEEQGINEDTAAFMTNKIRKSTQMAYNKDWRIWVSYCLQKEPPTDPRCLDYLEILKFSGQNKHSLLNDSAPCVQR